MMVFEKKSYAVTSAALAAIDHSPALMAFEKII
jgi:hypothetical protein